MGAFTYEDLVAWSRGLPLWQQDALRRILESGKLSEPDVEELVSISLARYCEDEQAPEAIGPSASGLPAQPGARHSVAVAQIKEISNANALAEGPIEFATEGLTIVYGGNATGKSGVARILKKACHARVPGNSLIPNVFRPEPAVPPSAVIDFLVDGRTETHKWVEGSPSNPDLATVHVFDSVCAEVQVGEPNHLAYTPEILAAFRTLAKCCETVGQKLREREENLGETPTALQVLKLDPESRVGRYVASLSASSDLKELEEICRFGDPERHRFEKLERALGNAPLLLAQTEEARCRRVSETSRQITEAEAVLSDAGSDEFMRRLSEARESSAAALAAREVFASQSSLKGVGSDIWQRLWKAAKDYSDLAAYVGEKFPVTREDALCVLCQQPLASDARARLQGFEAFVKSNLQQKADYAKQQIYAAAEILRGLRFGMGSRATVRDLGLTGSQAGDDLRTFMVTSMLRRRFLLRAIDELAPEARPELSAAPDLGCVQDEIRAGIAELKAASRSEDRIRMELERSELRDRSSVAPLHAVICAEIQRLKKARLLEKALADCATGTITKKQGEAEKSILTARLQASFRDFCASLGFSEIPIEISLGEGRRGEHPYEMRLVASQSVKPREVLCEGERTAVALAGLLAELEASENHSGVILDDPISSFDHNYRERVAETLAKEARSRQVVVLTHDVVFVFMLQKYARVLDVPARYLTLRRGTQTGGHGQAVAEPPWEMMNVNDRIKKLRQQLDRSRILAAPEYEAEARSIYDRLRQTWERAVEEILLNGAVLRFAEAVHTQRLGKIADDVLSTDVQLIDCEMSKCSSFLHDTPSRAAARPPGPDVIAGDIKRLEDWAKTMRKDRKRST